MDKYIHRLDDCISSLGDDSTTYSLSEPESSNFCEKVIHILQCALSDTDIYVFGEFLSHPVMHQIRKRHPEVLSLLELFAYGTYADYIAHRSQFSDLPPEQLRKIRQLSIVKAAATQRSLAYEDLRVALDLDSIQSLEDLLIEMISSGLVQGKLDQRNQKFRVHNAIGRDVRPDELSQLADSLEAWATNCQRSLGLLCSEMETSESRRAAHFTALAQLEEQIAQQKELLLSQKQIPAEDEGAASSAKSTKKCKLANKK